MPDSRPSLAPTAHALIPALRPSEYTAALIQVLRADAGRIRDARVLEIGSGSGVVLAALGSLGAAALCGVDIEAEAVASSALLLGDLGHGGIAELHRGDMWQPVAGRRFDLIGANLPHFPMDSAGVDDRLPTWSAGGADGRLLLDMFLGGLAEHLAPDGRAVITHNAFVDLGCSRDLLARSGLSLRIALTTLVYIAPEKLVRMTADVLRAEDGRTIHRYGPYTFGDVHIVEIEFIKAGTGAAA